MGQTLLAARERDPALRCTAISRVTLRAFRRGTLAHELRLPCPGVRRGDFGEPDVRRTALAVARCGRDLAVGPNQRKLAFERRLGDEHDPQRGALPRHGGRGEHGKPGLVLAIGGRRCGRRPRFGRAGGNRERCDQQGRDRDSRNLGCSYQAKTPVFPRSCLKIPEIGRRQNRKLHGLRAKKGAQSAAI